MRGKITKILGSLFCLAMVCFLEGSGQAVSSLGMVSDATMGPGQCSSFAFSVEKTITLPTGFDMARLVRVNRSMAGNVGYIYTETATGGQLTVFSLDDLTIISNTNTFSSVVYEMNLRAQGDVFSNNNLYFTLEMKPGQSTPFTTCDTSVAQNCVSIMTFSGDGVKLNEIADSSPLLARRVSNIDDVRESDNTIMMVVASPAGLREFRTYDPSTLLYIATGTATGISGFGHLSRQYNGFNYGVLGNASSTTWQFAVGNPTAIGTVTDLTAPRLPSAIYGMDPVFANPGPVVRYVMVTESDRSGGGAAQRFGASVSPFTASFLASYNVAVFAAAYESTFYDSINQRVYSVRNDGTGAVQLVREPLGPVTDPVTTQEVFSCPVAACNGVNGLSTGSQVADFSPYQKAIYIGSTTNPAKLSKIRVCS